MRKPRKPAGRPRWLLGRLATFCRNHGWWPSAAELTVYTERGSRWTTRRDLSTLRQIELVRNEGRRWAITLDGFALLGIRPIVPRTTHKPVVKSRKQRREEKRIETLRRLLAAHEVYVRPRLVFMPRFSGKDHRHLGGLEIVE